MPVEIIEAGPDLRPVVLNLGLYYIHDFTEFIGFRCPEGGLFRTSCWDKYWAEPGRWAFLIKVDGELAGFVLVRFVFEGRFGVPGPSMLSLVLTIMVMTVIIGLSGSTEVWRRPPLEVLRAE